VDSLNIGIASPSFSIWSGFFLNPDFAIALVVEYETEARRAQLELARIGLIRKLELVQRAVTEPPPGRSGTAAAVWNIVEGSGLE